MASPHTHGGDHFVCTNDDEFVRQAHEMDLEERRALVIKDIIDDENNFVVGTINWQLLEFFKYLHTNTDTFDPVMVSITLQSTNRDKNGNWPQGTLGFDENTMKDMILHYINEE